MMAALLAILTTRIGMAAAIVAGLVLFYEGVPLGPLRLIPFFGPMLETVGDGRVDRERRAGASAERQAWEEARRKLLAAQARQRREAQDSIDAAERRYIEEKAAREAVTEANTALQQALATSEADNAKIGNPSRPAISRGVSRALNAIGR